MNELEFLEHFKQQFPYETTQGQDTLMRRLTHFIFDDSPDGIFVLKGYAGTGKTSVVSALVKSLPRAGFRSVLLAPTGRAAKVLSVYSGKKAYTIHKKIYFQRIKKDGSVTLKLQENLHTNTMFFIDEASMISGAESMDGDLFSTRNLLDDLFEYVYSGKNCRMILIGDTAQLPPVGIPVSPALDLNYLKSRYEAGIQSCELDEVMRQSLESGILYNATRMREHISVDKINLPLFTILGFRDVEKITGSDLEEYLMDTFSGKQLEDSVVITRSNKRANLFNREIRKRILFRENDLDAGDYMMVVRNNYFWLEEDSPAGFIANGDIIEITRVGERENRFGYDFAEVTIKLLDYPELEPVDVKIMLNTINSESASLSQQEMRQLFDLIMAEYNDIPQRAKRLEKVRTNPYYNALQVKFAYSLTCHKTQGGQWENVFIDQGFLKIENVDKEYLRWLYTAFTRATKKIYLVGFNEKFF